MKLFSILLLSLVGCVASTQLEYYRPSVIVEDRPAEGRLRITVANQSSKEICFDVANWPNSEGEIDSANGRVALEVSGVKFDFDDLNVGYCPKCDTRAKPGNSIVGYLKYSSFGLTENYRNMPKKLIFSPVATSCEP
jgi:hypothetical protein